MMPDVCTVTRPGTPVFNSADGSYTAPATTVYTGVCRVRTRSLGFLRDRVAEEGDAQMVVWPYMVAVPASVTDVRVYDVVTITASNDPALVGVTMRVRIAGLGTNVTARKLDCEEIANA